MKTQALARELVLLALLLVSSPSPAAAAPGLSNGPRDPAQFNAIIQYAISSFAPLMALHGGTPQVSTYWSDPVVNAGTLRDPSGRIWTFFFHGGLLQAPELTPDGFTMTLCHEMGHEFGGYPFLFGTDYAASGGQADLFAAQVCARRLWGPFPVQNQAYRALIDPVGRALCDRAWGTPSDRDLCYRILVASQSATAMISRLDGSPRLPRIDAPDPTIAPATNLNHPLAQCRLDTFVAGALCARPWDFRLIPGDAQRLAGAPPAVQEQVSAPYNCARPACWFRPLVR